MRKMKYIIILILSFCVPLIVHANSFVIIPVPITKESCNDSYHGNFIASGTHDYDINLEEGIHRCVPPSFMHATVDMFISRTDNTVEVDLEYWLITPLMHGNELEPGCGGWRNGSYRTDFDGELNGTEFTATEVWSTERRSGRKTFTGNLSNLVNGVYTKISGTFINHEIGGPENQESHVEGSFELNLWCERDR